MGLADSLKSVNSTGILLPIAQFPLEPKEDCTGPFGKKSRHLHDLHDFTKTSLTHDLHEIEILQLQTPLFVLDKRDADLDRTGTELEVQPFGTQLTQMTLVSRMGRGRLLVIFFAQLGILDIRLGFLETRMHLDRTQEDIFASTGTRPSSGVSQIELNG